MGQLGTEECQPVLLIAEERVKALAQLVVVEA
jgi:hypothetical protein